MKSLVIFLVEHGETTDPVNQFTDEASDMAFNVPDLNLIDWTARVDIPDTDTEYTYRVMPGPASMVIGLASKDSPH